MFLKLAALVLCISYVTCNEFVKTRECNATQTHSTYARMEVSGCKSTDTRCKLIRGTNHTVILTVLPTENFLDRTDCRVYGVFEKFSVPYGKKTDACAAAEASDDGTACKDVGGFFASREYKHTSTFSVSNNYPMIELYVRFQLYDRRSKKSLLCLEVPVKIVNPLVSENEA